MVVEDGCGGSEWMMMRAGAGECGRRKRMRQEDELSCAYVVLMR
jgi:hypothetical protein